jgi:hypothetical protein
MYYTEQNPFTGEKLFVEKNTVKKENQKEILTKKPDANTRKKTVMCKSFQIKHHNTQKI